MARTSSRDGWRVARLRGAVAEWLARGGLCRLSAESFSPEFLRWERAYLTQERAPVASLRPTSAVAWDL
jgi:hypothetical protein